MVAALSPMNSSQSPAAMFVYNHARLEQEIRSDDVSSKRHMQNVGGGGEGGRSQVPVDV